MNNVWFFDRNISCRYNMNETKRKGNSFEKTHGTSGQAYTFCDIENDKPNFNVCS